ncbi:MAG: iron-containing alcohol dehydrogenase [Clostridiaceae bacterium]|nr:iron-containing alcohol dehydrogenase [Clostridiaceae bacterium]
MGLDVINFTIPQRLIFGSGSLRQVPGEALQLGAGKVLLLSDRPIMAELRNNLISSGMEVLCFDSFKGEPGIEVVNACLELAKGFNPDVCVGLGGGSVLDVSKVVSWAIGNRCYGITSFDMSGFKNPSIPMIMIATTSGTGSEATPNALFLDSNKKKTAVVSRHIMPHVAVVDPELTGSLPLSLTALTGIDAISHCVESFLSKNGSSWSDEVALKGVASAYKSLLRVLEAPFNLEARSDMAFASLCGGIALSNAGTCGVHALAYPLAGHGISHSQGIALMYPAVISFLIDSGVNKFNALCEAAGICGENIKKGLIGPVMDAMEYAKCPLNLREAGIQESYIEAMSEEASKQGRLLRNNPVVLSLENIKTLYYKAFDGKGCI